MAQRARLLTVDVGAQFVARHGVGDGIEVWDSETYEAAKAAEESELEALDTE